MARVCKEKDTHVDDLIFALQVAWVKLFDSVIDEVCTDLKAKLVCYLEDGWTKRGLKDLKRIERAIKRFEIVSKKKKLPSKVIKSFKEVSVLFQKITVRSREIDIQEAN